MKYFSLFSHKSVRTGKKKILPAKEVEQLLNAEEILEVIKKDAEEYREQVVKQCAILEEQAQRDGFEQGCKKLYSQHLHLQTVTKKLSEEVHKKILPLALQAAKKIVGEELTLNPKRIVNIILQALKPVVQHYTITIYVHPKDYQIVEEGKEEIKNILQQVTALKIEPREDVEQGGCIIETEAGIINAQLENQWRLLEQAFTSFMEGYE